LGKKLAKGEKGRRKAGIPKVWRGEKNGPHESSRGNEAIRVKGGAQNMYSKRPAKWGGLGVIPLHQMGKRKGKADHGGRRKR